MASTKKQASKKNTSKKTASKKKVSAKDRAVALAESNVFVRPKSGTPKLKNRQEIKKAIPASGIAVPALIEQTGCTLGTIEAMIKKGFIEAR